MAVPTTSNNDAHNMVHYFPIIFYTHTCFIKPRQVDATYRYTDGKINNGIVFLTWKDKRKMSQVC